MKLRIENFKSVEILEMELAPVTLLVGPPAGGKSNILDAIALIGYFNRINLLNEEYENNECYLESPPELLRISEHQHLFRYENLDQRIKIELKDKIFASLCLEYKEGLLHLSFNDVLIPSSNLYFYEVKSKIKEVKDKITFLDSRLYAFDRYGLAGKISDYVKGSQTSPYPLHVLSELGRNLPQISASAKDIIIDFNETLLSQIGAKIEFRILKEGRVALFDYYYEVDSSQLSDTLFRILYYLLALRSGINYAKLYGLERRFFILLEEPEAHSFPYFFNMLCEKAKEASKVAYVVITTHNPLLISKLWDKISELKTYYICRDESGRTSSFELDLQKLALDLAGPEELLLLPVNEVIEKYTKH